MKIGKRLLALVLAVTLVMSCGISIVLAQGGSFKNSGKDSGGISITSFQVSNKKIQLGYAATMSCEYICLDANGDVVNNGVTLEFSSSNTAVATVTNIYPYKIESKGVGTATITVTVKYGNLVSSDSINIEVVDLPADSSEKQALKDAIDANNAYANGYVLSTDGDDVFTDVAWTTPEKYAENQAAVKEAKAIYEKESATKSEVERAKEKMIETQQALGHGWGDREKSREVSKVSYYNGMEYISIDTSGSSGLSDYASVRSINITGVRVMCDPDNPDSFELYNAVSAQFGFVGISTNLGNFRLKLKSGKTLSKSMYLVPIMVQLENGKGAQVDVELHVNATDPAYFKTSEAVFEIADFSNPGNEAVSSTVVIQSPSGEEITGIRFAEKSAPYTSVGGKWDAAKKEYSFQLKATKDKESGILQLTDVKLLVSFAGKARMAFKPATVPVYVVTSDQNLKQYVSIRPEYLNVGDNQIRKIGVYPTREAYEAYISIDGYIQEITNFKSQPANAIVLQGGAEEYYAKANAKGTATFDAVATFYENGLWEMPLFKVRANRVRWTVRNASFAAPFVSKPESKYSIINSNAYIDINDLNTYTVEIEAEFYNDKGMLINLEQLELVENSEDNHLFKITKQPVRQQNGHYLFSVTLQNVAETLMDSRLILNFNVKAGGKEFQCDTSVSLTSNDGGPKDIYLTKNGKRITTDSLVVGAASTTYGIVVDGYKMVQGDMLNVSAGSPCTIVRGKVFYSDMGANENVTIRMDEPIPEGEQARVRCSLLFWSDLKITNPAVKFKMANNVVGRHYYRNTLLTLTSKQFSDDKMELKAAIDAATAAKKGIYISVNGSNISKTSKWVTPATMTAFENAITEAQAVLNNAAATADEIIVATDMMKKATADFVNAQKYGTKSSGGSSGGSSSGSSGGTSTPSAPSQPTSKEVNSDGSVNAADTAKTATNAIKNALASNNKNASVVIENAKTITAAALKEIANAAKAAGGNVKLNFDTTVDGKTVARIAIDPAKAVALGKTINLTVAVDAATTAPVVNHFSKYFANDVAVASFAQAGEFGMTVDVAVRVDLTNIDLNKLQVYSYDRATNKYVKVNPGKVYVDKNGFLHFQTNRGGDLLFSNGPLTAK